MFPKHRIMGPFLFFLLISLSTISLSSSSSSSDLTNLIYKGCANQDFQDPNSQQALKTLYSTLLSQSSTAHFYKTTTNSLISGLFQCRGDLSASACQSCVTRLPPTITRLCGPNTMAARVQLTGCYMRYEVVGFRQVSGTEFLYKQCGSTQASGTGFRDKVDAALGEIEKGVVGSGNGFYAGGYQGVYVLGQCEGDLSSGDCVSCIKSAEEKSKSECGSAISGHVYLQTCYISYTYYPDGISGNSPSGMTMETATGTGTWHNTQKTVAIVVGGVVGLGLGIACLLVLKSAFKKKKDKYGGY